MQDSIVYVLQEPTSEKDFSSAVKYGKIVPIIGQHDKPSWNVNLALQKLSNALKNYNPETDYICFPGGDPLVQLLAGIMLERHNVKEVNYLQWNRKRDVTGRTTEGFYVPKKIQIAHTERKYEDFSHESEY